MDITSLNLVETKQALAEKKFSAEELTNAYLERIKVVDPQLNSYVFINERVVDEAKNSDKQGSFAGIPLGQKDNFCTKGLPSTAASKILEGYIPPFDATCIARLKEAGVLTLGKLNTDEFTMGSSTETSAYGTSKNPWDIERVPGGSSGGSAAAVAADLCVAATGSDTGGSIRQPASFCGVTGFKPTYGRISRYGVIPMASSLDTVGTLTKTVADAALMLEIMAGNDPLDATTGDKPVLNYFQELQTDIKGVKIGIPKEYFIEGIDPEVEKAVREAISELEKLGAEVKEISLPHSEYAVATYYVVASSEISANMARFDGIRYGPTVKDSKDLIDTYIKNRTKGFGDEVKRRIMLGTFALSAGYADKFYKQGLKVRTLIKQDFDKAFAEVDLIAAPAVPSTAFKVGEKIDDPIQMYLNDILTIPSSLAGLPALSVPCGFANGLPVGLQMITPQWEELRVLSVAHTYQMATEWHKHKPELANL